MNDDKKNKIKNIIKYIFVVIFILFLLFVLVNHVNIFNKNYRDYEFKLVNKDISVTLGQKIDVPIVTINNEIVDKKDYTYTSVDNSIVTVTDDGKITANNVGSTIVVVKAKKSNQKELLNVNVFLMGEGLAVKDFNLEFNELKIKLGNTYNVNYEIIPKGAIAENIIWSTSNSSIATVNKGEIFGKNVGNCVVYINIDNIIKEIKINVYD